MRISDWRSDVCSSDLSCARRLCGGVSCPAGGGVRKTGADADLFPRTGGKADRACPSIGIAAAPARTRARRGEHRHRHLRRLWPLFHLLGQWQRDGYASLEAQSGASLVRDAIPERSEEHTSELQSIMRISYAVFCLKKKKKIQTHRI